MRVSGDTDRSTDRRHRPDDPVGANGRPAWGECHRNPHGGPLHCTGVVTATCTAEGITELTHFESGTAAGFGLPRTLAALD